VPSTPNFFFQKGFQGSEKSPFEVLQDIFKDKDDNNLFFQKDVFDVSNSIKATLQSFMEDDEVPTQPETGLSFFDTYKPTFMNPDFLMPSSDFESGIADKSYTAHILSFFSSASEGQMFTTATTTISQNSSSTSSSSVQEMFINQNGHFGTQGIIDGKENKPSSLINNNNKLYERYYAQCSGEDNIMVINDNDDLSDDMTSQVSNKDAKFINRRRTDDIIEELNAQLRDSVSLNSKKISKDKSNLNIRLMNKKPSKKNRS